MNNQILIVDDDRKIASLMDYRLKNRGYETHCVYSGNDAIAHAESHEPALVMLDMRLPDISGVEVLKAILKKQPATCVIMISAHADIKVAVECIKIGAYDFLEKPFEFPAVDAKVEQVFKRYRLEEEVDTLKRELGEKYQYKTMVGKSSSIRKVYGAMDIAAKSDANVLIHGESGTGKELVARGIHFSGLHKEGPFVAINCGAIPENLIESELFGHEKGSFTGAGSRKIGKFEQAGNGTLFLDEIGELPLSLQVKLLRVIQEREIERVGGDKSVAIKARFIFATNQDLKKLIREGRFREDLYFRIHVFPIRTPPLRERKEDIPELFRNFIMRSRKSTESMKVGPGVLEHLTDYDWQGNIRELENFVERLMLLIGSEDVITEAHLNSAGIFKEDSRPTVEIQEDASGDREQVLGNAEKILMENALREAGGNISKASKLIRVSRDTFYRKMKKYQLNRNFATN